MISDSLRKKEKNSKDAEAQVEEETEEDEIQEVVSNPEASPYFLYGFSPFIFLRSYSS